MTAATSGPSLWSSPRRRLYLAAALTAAAAGVVITLSALDVTPFDSIQWGTAAEWVPAVGTIGAIVFAGLQLRHDQDARAEQRALARRERMLEAFVEARSLGLWVVVESDTRPFDDGATRFIHRVTVRCPEQKVPVELRLARLEIPTQPNPLHTATGTDGSSQHRLAQGGPVATPQLIPHTDDLFVIERAEHATEPSTDNRMGALQ